MKFLGLSLLALIAAAPLSAFAKDAADIPDSVKINQIQVLGTHNSYSIGVDPRVKKVLGKALEGFFEKIKAEKGSKVSPFVSEEHPNPVTPYEMLNYTHPPLKSQLDLGMRSLEIDINPDPNGGNFLNPRAYEVLKAQGVKDLLPYDATDMEKPGFKVLHIPDSDFRTSCTTLKICLTQIKEWSDANPDHIPLFIMLEVKSQAIPIFPNPTQVMPMTPNLFDDLDKEIIDTLGRDKIITPDDIRGNYPTLKDAVLAKNWPSLKQARGKIIFLMLTATGPTGATAYLEGHDNLKGRIAFLRAEPDSDYAAFLLLDNSLVRKDDIEKYVKQGYMVRTRADIETYEAKINDMTRANSAFSSGAQVVSTDFELLKNEYGTSYHITMPGSTPTKIITARCSPIYANLCK